MSTTVRWIPALLLAAVSIARAQSAEPPPGPPVWPVTSAPAYLSIYTGQPKPSPRLMIVAFVPPDPKWLTMPVRVFTDTGIAVGADIVATAPGEPATLLFDTSSGTTYRYKLFLGSNWPPMHVADPKAGVWMETREGDGKVINNLPDMLKAWNESTKVLGHAVLQGIYEGGNRFGPQGNLLIHFQGWFDVTAPEHLQFAAISADASFVLVDGKELIDSPGLHERWWGAGGPPQGTVDLAVGPHTLDYYNAYVATPEGNPPVTACLAVKGGAFADWTMLTGYVPFFRAVPTGGIDTYVLQKDVPGLVTTGVAPPLAIRWTIADQSVIRTDLLDVGLINLTLTCLDPKKAGLTWTFDDGTTAEGQQVSHLFLRPGLRTVHLAMKTDGKDVGALDQTIAIHPDWLQPARQPGVLPAHEADVLGRDLTALSASDLASAFAVFQFFLHTDSLAKLAPAVTAKMNAVGDSDLPYIEKGAALLARDDWAHAADQIALLHALIDRCGQAKPAPEIAPLASQARLALARLVYRTSDKLDDVKALVEAIKPGDLTGEEPRTLNILKADLALAAGDVPGARTQYLANTNDPSGPDVRSSIRRTAKIGQARAFLDRKDYGAAEDALNQVAWQAPIEKLSPDWALTRLRLYQEEGLPVPAYLWAKRLLPVITDTGRSELLFRLTDLAFAQGDNDLATKSLSELLKKHPYSEQAADAKQKWPGKG